jgi:transcriptional regulator with XRE-family HTH domain
MNLARIEGLQELEAGLSLDQLAEAANRDDEATRAHVAKGLAHAARAGEALLQAKQQLKRGQFSPWLERNFSAGRTQAFLYMRIARNYDFLISSEVKSVSAAKRSLRYLTLPGEQTERFPDQPFDALQEQAKYLQAEGMSLAEVAAALGVSKTAVGRLLNPGRYRKEQARRARARSREAAALRREERDRAVKGLGGSVAEAYSMLRKTAQVIARAEEESRASDVRAGLKAALARVYAAEDEIVRALGVE